MQISHLREMIVLAQNHSFTQTAIQLYTTQSAISKHISALEQDLGVALFLRDRNNVELTDAGSIFIEYAQRIVNDYNEGIVALNRFNAGINRNITVGYLAGAVSAFLPEVVSRFMESHSCINLEFHTQEIDGTFSGLEDDSLDMVITTEYIKFPTTIYHVEKLYRDHIAVIVPKDHRLASRESVHLKDLIGEKIIFSSPSFMIREAPIIENLIAPIRDKITLVQSANDIWSLFMLISSGRYVTVLFDHVRNYSDFDQRFAFLRLEEAPKHFDVVAVWKRRAESDVMMDLVTLLRDVISERGVL
ncbi:LysR family transcriptional regulator [Adlercreutzia sp. ZJ154]|uniref:LysR family transcriptional regulator n=1 Tax=Adlercreutzia sp. ZJ154 TaxID=2709790 RepID=UPI0013EDD197